jgi:hypothetical protein
MRPNPLYYTKKRTRESTKQREYAILKLLICYKIKYNYINRLTLLSEQLGGIMHEQPCTNTQDLLKVNYKPEKSKAEYLFYAAGITILTIPLLDILGISGLQQGFGLFALGYYGVSALVV